MKNRKNQGFVHLLIISIIVVFGLIVVISYIVLQNLNQNETINSSNSNNIEVELTEIAHDKTMGTNLAIKYPKTWKLDYQKNNPSDSFGNLDSESSTITSPDGNTTVKFNVYHTTGIGINCYEVDKVDVLDSGAILNYPSATFIAFYGKSNNPESEGCHFIGATLKGDINTNQLFETGRYILGFDGNLRSLNGELLPITTIEVEFSNLGENSTPSDIIQLMTTSDYMIAKRIVQSLYVK